MVIMILSEAKLFWSLIYIISRLSNHLLYHRHKDINSKLYLEQIWRLILWISKYHKLRFVWLLLMGKTLILFAGIKKLEESFISNFLFKQPLINYESKWRHAKLRLQRINTIQKKVTGRHIKTIRFLLQANE